jgi:hypothetical protein
MSNIGAGELYDAYLVKKANVTLVDSMIKDTVVTSTEANQYMIPFRYRYLTSEEMTFQPLSAYLKGRYDRVLYTSEKDITFRERDKVLFTNSTTPNVINRSLNITRIIPQVQHGMFMITKKPPHILEMS